MRIGIDVDGVLADQVRAVLALMNALYPDTRHVYNDVTHWGGLQELYGISETTLLRHMETVWAQHAVGWLIDPHELQGLIRRLHTRGHTVHIISKRTPKSWPYVMGWLCAVPLGVDSISLLSTGSKYDFPVDIMLDDNPKLAAEAVLHNKHLFLVDQPWNQEIVDGEHVTRAQSVGEGLDMLSGESCE